MSEPMRAPMRRQRTSGRRITPAALLPEALRPSTESPMPGHLCEICLDAPAVTVVPAPWGGEMGVCAACAGLPPAEPAAPRAVVPACLVCAQPPGPDEDATAYVQHCMDSGHPLRPGPWRVPPGTRITLRRP
jgi:hypothetical protein